jgi:hypothetical protein
MVGGPTSVMRMNLVICRLMWRLTAVSLWPVDCSVSRAAFLLCVVCCQAALRALSPSPSDCSTSVASSLPWWFTAYEGLKLLRPTGRVLSFLSSPLQCRTQCSVLLPLLWYTWGTPVSLNVCSLWVHSLVDLCSEWEAAWPTGYKVHWGHYWLSKHQEGKPLK